MRAGLVTASVLLLAACNARGPHIEIDYDLTGVDANAVARLETIIHVDPKDGRQFFVDQPYRAVQQGIGYEVRDIDGDGIREVVLLHEASLGFRFANRFTFRLLPPANGTPPPLVLRARAYGPSSALGEASDESASYAKNGKVKLALLSTLCGGMSCGPNEACCDGACIATDSDPEHCGTCPNKCGNNSDGCVGGVCRCNGGAACADGQTCCAGAGCLDLTSDPFNCGACGKACNPGETCSGGACLCGTGAACDDGVTCCVNGSAGTCSTTGSCACGGSVECASPSVCCDPTVGLCANLMEDDANCGACGKACAPGLHCSSGSCRCAGQICAPGDECCADGCHTLANDPDNCGACGKVCRPGELCSGSSCDCGGSMVACGADQTCCGTACANTAVDARNCGGCDIKCQPGESCTRSACSCNDGPACGIGKTCCPGAGCVDLKSDPLHCNSCEKACATGESCVSGNCKQTSCSPSCALNSNECVDGVCFCSTGSAPGPACTGSQTCCPGQGCIDLLFDPANCAKCGNKCGAQQQCCNGQCKLYTLPCAVGTTCGNGTCSVGTQCCPGCPDATGNATYTCESALTECPLPSCPQPPGGI